MSVRLLLRSLPGDGQGKAQAMTDLMYTINKIDAAGSVVISYPGRRVERGPSHITLEAFFALRDRLELSYTVFERGDRMVEHFFSNRWYNVFECHAVGSDALRGWYCNIARPAIIDDQGAEVRQTDLALDLWVGPDRRIQLLDEEESTRELRARLVGEQANGNGSSLFPKQAQRFRWGKWP